MAEVSAAQMVDTQAHLSRRWNVLVYGTAGAGIAYAFRCLACWTTVIEAPVPGGPFASPRVPIAIGLSMIGALIWSRRHELDARGGSPSAAWPWLLAAVALHAWASRCNAPDLLLIALGLGTVGLLHLLLARDAANRLCAPLLLLFFCLPLPGSLYNATVWRLQESTCSLILGLLTFLGVPAARDGFLIASNNSTVTVVESCSGISSIHAACTLISAYCLYARRPPLHAAATIAGAGTLAWIGNGLRATAIVLYPRLYDEPWHSAAGTLAVTSAIILAARLESSFAPSASIVSRARERAVSPQPWTFLTAAAWIALCLASSLAVRPFDADAMRRPWSMRIPARFEGRLPQPTPVQTRFRGSLAVRWQIEETYVGNGPDVQLLAAYDDLGDRRRSLVSPVHALPGPEWEVEDSGQFLDPNELRGSWAVARHAPHRQLVMWSYRGETGTWGEALRAQLASDRSDWGRSDGIRLLRVATEILPTRDGRREAEARLRALLDKVADRFGAPR